MKRKTIIVILIISIIVAAAGIGAAAIIFRGGDARPVNASELSVGEKYLAELNYEKAAATLERVITVEPNNAEAYIALAKAYSYMGDAFAAIGTLENGLEATGSKLLWQELAALGRTVQKDSQASPGQDSDLESPSQDSDLENPGQNSDFETPDQKNLGQQSGTPAIPASSPAIKDIEIAGHIYPSDAKELVLRGCGLSNADLQKLTEFNKLEWLDISGNEITDISEIAKITTLKKFYAANNTISDVSALAALPAIEYIGLRGNQITDADALFGIASLKYLHLSDNQIAGVSQIGENLLLLYLANNKISETSTITGAGLLYYDISGNAGR